jgi:predicted nucleotidyltransferase
MKSLQDIIDTLNRLKPILEKKYFVSSIGLFGSIVRNEQIQGSDIDIVVDFNRPIGIEFVDLADYLESELKNKVDLISLKGIKQKYLNAIKSDIVYV